VKHKLIRALIFSLAALLCVSVSSQSQEKQKPRKFGWSLEQQIKENDRKKGAEENKGSNPAQPETRVVTELEADTMRIETALVVFDLLVLAQDKSPVTGLKKEDFEVFEEGSPQEIGTFALGDGSTVPRSIILIIDYSSSQLAYINDSVEAAKVLVDKLKPRDRMAVITDNVSLLVPFTQDKTHLKKGLDSLKRASAGGNMGKSLQWSALLATLQELASEEERPIIVLQTDGDETGSLKGIDLETTPAKFRKDFGLEDISREMEKSRATIYTIIPGLRLLNLPREEQLKNMELILRQESEALAAARWLGGRSSQLGFPRKLSVEAYEWYLAQRLRQHSALTEISLQSGGWSTYLEKPAFAADIYAQLFTSIEQRYILGYYPANSTFDGKRRKVEFKIRNHPEYQILGRKAYYNLKRRKSK
jgi:VWFA-related protein